MNRLKGFCEGVTVCLCVAFCLWVNHEYRNTEYGYTIAHRAELQAKFENLVPLSVADIGEDYGQR